MESLKWFIFFLHLQALKAGIRLIHRPGWWINLSGSILCFPLIISGRSQWAAIWKGAGQTGHHCSKWTAVYRYFRETYQKHLFSQLLICAPDLIISPALTSELNHLLSLQRGKAGVLLIGAHYGPPWSLSFLLSQKGIRSGPYLAGNHLASILEATRSRAGHERNYLIRFLSTLKLIPRGSEIAFIRHLLDGHYCTFANDMPTGRSHPSIPAPFLGKSYRFSLFPFRASCRYGFPIWYFTFRKDRRYGYSLHLEEISFRTPEEGLQKYIRLLEKEVRAFPWSWLQLSAVSTWTEERKKDEPYEHQ